MNAWLAPALDYVEDWLGFQMRLSGEPGCAIAVAHAGRVLFERAFGMADLAHATPLTPRHRFRVASHSKSFTAAALMALVQAGRLRLDDPVGAHVAGLPDPLASARIGQLLSHSAGLMRDGTECGHWNDQKPFPDAAGLRHQLSQALVLCPGERFKYSNLGFGLLGLVLEAVTGEAFAPWLQRELLDPAGLHETAPDMPAGAAEPLATGHTGKLPVGRMAIAGRNPTGALAAATGFVATTGDLARFFASLDAAAAESPLSIASRREMTRPHWKSPYSEADVQYGLGIITGTAHGHAWFGHSGAFQGCQSRTCVVPDWSLSVALVINAIDGPANGWVDGVLHILDRFAKAGPPAPDLASWRGRWWSLWGAFDLVPIGDRVLVASPDTTTPFTDASEIEVIDTTHGRITQAHGFASHGEPVERTLDSEGSAVRLRLAGEDSLPEAAFVNARHTA
ncbi:serine hydrolase domain-containing protein [Lichenicoccus sp.]|uniref:serine hydrolase domain-containing protein n=1 Tax=Lichenicoccus sp. TaxID=2781899 RepID=UPI003D127D46